MDILDGFEPVRAVYYERPAVLLERMGRYQEAIRVCERAIQNPKLARSVGEFAKRKERLQRRLAR